MVTQGIYRLQYQHILFQQLKKISKLVGNPALSEISNLKIYKYKQALAPKMANKIWLDLSTIGLILLITGYANKPKLSQEARCICLAS